MCGHGRDQGRPDSFHQVDAQGEVAFVKDNINEMIRNLKDTTLRNEEQNWLKTNLTRFLCMLQGQRDLLTVGKLILSELAPLISAQQGVFYIIDGSEEEPEAKTPSPITQVATARN